MRKSKGFTLIELLVVIAIIGILATLITVNLSAARAKARDARRKADLDSIRTAIEMYNDENGNYPYHDSWVYSTDSGAWSSLESELSRYLSTLPKDPLNRGGAPWGANGYRYAYRSSGGSTPQIYDLVTQLENHNDSDRCELKCWKYHRTAIWAAGVERPWCPPCPNYVSSYSPYMYADH